MRSDEYDMLERCTVRTGASLPFKYEECFPMSQSQNEQCEERLSPTASHWLAAVLVAGSINLIIQQLQVCLTISGFRVGNGC